MNVTEHKRGTAMPKKNRAQTQKWISFLTHYKLKEKKNNANKTLEEKYDEQNKY